MTADVQSRVRVKFESLEPHVQLAEKNIGIEVPLWETVWNPAVAGERTRDMFQPLIEMYDDGGMPERAAELRDLFDGFEPDGRPTMIVKRREACTLIQRQLTEMEAEQ